MLIIGVTIATIAGSGILAVGVLYLAIPRTMAANFGLPVVPGAHATPWLRLKGIRDLATGIAAFVLLLAAEPHVLAGALLAFAIVPVGDAMTILGAGGSRQAALFIHGSTASLMLVGAGALLLA